jgi:LacI family transcriptional regulator
MPEARTTSRGAGAGAAPAAAGPARTRPRGRGGVTLTDVAAAAGVSVPTVSKVLNGHPDVSPATRARVQEAISSSGYARRVPARPPRAGLVDLIITDVDTPWAAEIIDGAERAAARAEAGLVVSTTHGGPLGGERWLRRLAARGSDGLVLAVSATAPGAAERLAELHLPLVLLDPVGGADPALPTVGATNWQGGVAATEHLLEQGHRRIGMVTGLDFLACSQERLEGYRAAMGRAGVAVDEALVHSGDFLPGGGRRAAAAMLDLADPPTAVFAGSDLQACGVYQEVHARGMRIPEDLSVVGFDDIAICEYLTPPLTTVRQPLAEMAGEAVRLVLEMGDGQDGDLRPHRSRLELATRLVLRDSTAPPEPKGLPQKRSGVYSSRYEAG